MSLPGLSLRHEAQTLIQVLPASRSTQTNLKTQNPFPLPLESVVVFSHLRWDFVFQRPQHLLTRCAGQLPVYYVEEPVFGEPGSAPWYDLMLRGEHLKVVVPHLPGGLDPDRINEALKALLDQFFEQENLQNYLLWYYTPMALPFSRHLRPAAIIYDCMDELSLFQGAPPSLLDWEKELFGRADVVFTGGHSLYQHKRSQHPNIHPFPSSIEAAHFGKARLPGTLEPEDQQPLSGPKIGFFGVIDERMDLVLLDRLAASHPEWNIILLGPVVKVDPATLPCHPNLHYLGFKSYGELPAYLKGWDVAILPFALNESTRFISPTKTPEYLAAGVPVVSTAITDVVNPYQVEGLVRIGLDPDSFIQAVEDQLRINPDERAALIARADEFLAAGSWDQTWQAMLGMVRKALSRKPVAVGTHPPLPASPTGLPAPGGEPGLNILRVAQ